MLAVWVVKKVESSSMEFFKMILTFYIKLMENNFNMLYFILH